MLIQSMYMHIVSVSVIKVYKGSFEIKSNILYFNW